MIDAASVQAYIGLAKSRPALLLQTSQSYHRVERPGQFFNVPECASGYAEKRIALAHRIKSLDTANRAQQTLRGRPKAFEGCFTKLAPYNYPGPALLGAAWPERGPAFCHRSFWLRNGVSR